MRRLLAPVACSLLACCASGVADVDRQLAAMMRLAQAERGAKKSAKVRQLHFKLRALDLLDVLARKQPPSPLLLLLPRPLLEAMAQSAPNETSADGHGAAALADPPPPAVKRQSSKQKDVHGG